MIKIKGGVFEMGGDVVDGFETCQVRLCHKANDLPKHTVQVGDFGWKSMKLPMRNFKNC